MGTIILGLATSHSPLLTFDVNTWIEKAEDDTRRRLNLSDGRMVTYDELKKIQGERRHHESTREVLEQQRQRCQASLDVLADALERAAPDLVVIVGDDQGELFSLTNMPAIAIFYGKQLVTHPWGDLGEPMPDWKRTAAAGYGMESVHTYQGAPEAATHTIECLIEQGVDIGASSEVTDPRRAGFGHAYGFIAERLFRGRAYPILPVLLNT